jgi:hypothetical protein
MLSTLRPNISLSMISTSHLIYVILSWLFSQIMLSDEQESVAQLLVGLFDPNYTKPALLSAAWYEGQSSDYE